MILFCIIISLILAFANGVENKVLGLIATTVLFAIISMVISAVKELAREPEEEIITPKIAEVISGMAIVKSEKISIVTNQFEITTEGQTRLLVYKRVQSVWWHFNFTSQRQKLLISVKDLVAHDP